MTVLTLALLAGSQPAAPRLAPVHQIGPQSRRQSPHTPCAPLVRTDALTLTWQKADRHKRSAPTSSSHTPWPNPHSACGTAAAPLPAISCLGAFRPPAARARGEVRHCRQPKTCTTAEVVRAYVRRRWSYGCNEARYAAAVNMSCVPRWVTTDAMSGVHAPFRCHAACRRAAGQDS